MANTKRNLVGAAVVAATLLTGSQTMAADATRTLVLHVDNYAQVSDEVLRDAEKVASSIYAAAGVRTMWVSGQSEIRSTDPSVAYLSVIILNREMAEQKIAAEKIGGANVLGRAAGPTKRAYIFYHRISDVATTRQAIVNDLLGKVMAHEVGHLVLTPGHSDRGIMRADIDLRPTAPQRFTKDQVATIHNFLAPASAN